MAMMSKGGMCMGYDVRMKRCHFITVRTMCECVSLYRYYLQWQDVVSVKSNHAEWYGMEFLMHFNNSAYFSMALGSNHFEPEREVLRKIISLSCYCLKPSWHCKFACIPVWS